MIYDKNNKLSIDYTCKTILTISDCHFPYNHPDTLDFLGAVKETYTPDLVVSVGDLKDFHNISFHDSDPDLMSGGHELEKSRELISELEDMFPSMYIVGSNHGDLPLRKFIAKGLPRELMSSYNEIYGVSDEWKFVDDLTISVKGRDIPDLYICHNVSKNALSVARNRGQRFVCGHYHENFEIRYSGTPNNLLWSMMVGCLINPKSYAFAYNKLNLHRPILGTGLVVNGLPVLEPMVLNSKGRWIGNLV